MDPRAGGRYSQRLPRSSGLCPIQLLERGFLDGKKSPILASSLRMIFAAICRAQAETMRKNQLLLERLQQVATRYDATLQIALNWVMSKGEDIVLIPGARKLPICVIMPEPPILPSLLRIFSPSKIFFTPITSPAYAITRATST